jgi:hypothetical protein
VPAHVAEGVVPDDRDMPQSRGRVGLQRLDLCCRLLGGERGSRSGSDRMTCTRSGLRETGRQPSRPTPRCHGDGTGDHRNGERRRCQPAQRGGIEGHDLSLSAGQPHRPSHCRVSRPGAAGVSRAGAFCRDVTKGPDLPACRARIDVSARKPAFRGHLRPVDGTSAPTRRYICAHSTGHLRPLDATFAPTRPPVRSQPRSRASQAAASLKSESAVPAVTDVTTESARGYEPRNLTSSEVRRSPISASPTRASAT